MSKAKAAPAYGYDFVNDIGLVRFYDIQFSHHNFFGSVIVECVQTNSYCFEQTHGDKTSTTCVNP